MHHRILRYKNRKLYSHAISDYVSRRVIAGFIGRGDSVEVVQSETGEDITTEILLQVLSWQCEQGLPPPRDLLLAFAQTGQFALAKQEELAHAES